MRARRELDVEKLLQWAYREELPKRITSASGSSWDRLSQYGSLGGINPKDHNMPQRYAHVGEPHPDALRIEYEVAQLPELIIDWPDSTEAILGELAPLVAINQLHKPDPVPGPTTRSGWRTKGGQWRSRENRPRDMILVNRLNTAALITMHAAKGTRPDWADEHPQPMYIQADRRPPGTPAVVGDCRGRNLYATGSYCPLRWEPSPLSIAQLRADYWCWYRGLERLTEQLELEDYIALPPAAPGMPWWGEREPPRRIFAVGEAGRDKPLPLKPQRPRTGSARAAPRAGPVRSIPTFEPGIEDYVPGPEDSD